MKVGQLLTKRLPASIKVKRKLREYLNYLEKPSQKFLQKLEVHLKEEPDDNPVGLFKIHRKSAVGDTDQCSTETYRNIRPYVLLKTRFV